MILVTVVIVRMTVLTVVTLVTVVTVLTFMTVVTEVKAQSESVQKRLQDFTAKLKTPPMLSSI